MEDPTKPRKQRLAIFLDGTWNTQDDSTNIFHAHALTLEGLTKDGFIQKKYYDRGVGTGMFDSVLGGGFGVGLEVNVREAYNWLVDHYNDGDEVYIFGFSRGAYTARSLVGFISMCGLIRRGAPLTNSQLWDGYVRISRRRGGKKTLLEMVGEMPPPPFRPIKQIRKGHGKDLTENLLKQWSRRIEIKFLGIFDTVGAMGLEALGLQGIRSRSGMNHNQNPTKLIQQCRHALAIDENRSSFRLTPFLHYVPNQIKTRETVEHEGYRGIISQKWFIGAHSNIGGGYNNNLLAYYPLRWVLEGALEEGLKMKELKPSDFPANVNQVNDSYSDFTGLIWPHILREKRHYRIIDREDIIVAGRYGKRDEKTGHSKRKEPGFSLVPIHEEIDSSVIDLIKGEKEENYAPINLINYANRLEIKVSTDSELTVKEKTDNELIQLLKGRIPNEKWLDEKPIARLILVFWATFAAIGFSFFIDQILINTSFFKWQYLAILATIFSVTDWGEYHFNLKTGLVSTDVKANVFQNVFLWFRLIGIICFFAGSLIFVLQSINWGWDINLTLEQSVHLIKEKNLYLIPFFPAIFIMTMDLIYNGKITRYVDSPNNNLIKRLGTTLISPLILLALGLVIIFIADYLDAFSINSEDYSSSSKSEQLAGQLLFIQILFLALNYIIIWVQKPTRRARIQFIIFGLQKAYTPERVKNILKVVRFNINRLWVAKESSVQKSLAWNHAREIIHKTIYRDNLGFIPAYSLTFGLTMWLGSTYGQLEYWIWLKEFTILNFPIWMWVVAITAIADYGENWIHFKHLDNFPEKDSSPTLVATGMIFTLIKFLGFIPSVIISILIYLDFSVNVLLSSPGGWRWMTTLIVTLLLIYITTGLTYRLIRKKLL